jgi:uncharacterized membrane protein
MIGTGLRPDEIKNFLEASYEQNAPIRIDDYILDEELSNLYGKVYVNEEIKKLYYRFVGQEWKTSEPTG